MKLKLRILAIRMEVRMLLHPKTYYKDQKYLSYLREWRNQKAFEE